MVTKEKKSTFYKWLMEQSDPVLSLIASEMQPSKLNILLNKRRYLAKRLMKIISQKKKEQEEKHNDSKH